jgi:hypothetical protein
MADYKIVRVQPVIQLTLSKEEAEAARKILGRNDSSAGEANTWPVYKAICDALKDL